MTILQTTGLILALLSLAGLLTPLLGYYKQKGRNEALKFQLKCLEEANKGIK